MAAMKCGWRSDGIKDDPVHLPHIVDDMKHYLWILKTVHAGSDLETMVVMAQVRPITRGGPSALS
eukprot:7677481-Pyramimonas_sp.AAC.1